MKRSSLGHSKRLGVAAMRPGGGATNGRLVTLAVLALVPVLTLAAALIGAGTASVAALMVLQAAVLGLLLRRNTGPPAQNRLPAPSRVAQPRNAVEALLAGGAYPAGIGAGDTADGPDEDGAALVLLLDDSDRLHRHHGPRYVAALMQELTSRLGQALRAEDAFCHLPPEGFAIALQARSGLDVGTVLAISRRLQAQLATRFRFESVGIWPSVSIGLCVSAQAARRQGLSMIDAAARSAERAKRAGPAGLHSFSVIDTPGLVTCDRREELEHAIRAGRICAHFQPQIAAASGAVSGIEALARWEHPKRGLIAPGDFLPLIESAGLGPQLARRMLDCALSALVRLDAAGLAVPTAAINLSMPELRNPALADEIAWALELHELPPERLVIEILEDVIAHGDDDIMVRNIARLAGMGCGIDLDDFGTGHASIASIRRFAVSRIKIDRSFISNLHRDEERHRMAGAIMSMAEGLGLETVAEGVESTEDMTLVAAMGCTHLQGFGIARPMPESALADWLRGHTAQDRNSSGPAGAADATAPRAAPRPAP